MFKPLHMGTNHMLGIDSYTPLTTNNFEIRIYNMDGTSPTENSDLLTLSTDSLGPIKEDQDEIIVHYGNGYMKFPAKTTFSNVDWILNCYCKPNVLEALRSWRKQVYDATTEKMGLPSEYMKQVFFLRYDGAGNAREALRCPGTWINGIDNGDYDQKGGDIVKVKVQLVISRVIYMTADELR